MAINTPIQEADRRMLRYLRANRSATVSQLLAATGVSRSAIRQRLVRLQALGLIWREPVRRGRGRPFFVYRLTREAEQQFGWLLPELAAGLWLLLSEQADQQARQQLTDRLAKRLARPIRAKIGMSVGLSRLRSFVSLLNSQGLEVELDLSGPCPVIRQHDCPFGALPIEAPDVCKLSQTIVSSVLGSEVAICCCRAVDQQACWCEYRVSITTRRNGQPQPLASTPVQDSASQGPAEQARSELPTGPNPAHQPPAGSPTERPTTSATQQELEPTRLNHVTAEPKSTSAETRANSSGQV